MTILQPSRKLFIETTIMSKKKIYLVISFLLITGLTAGVLFILNTRANKKQITASQSDQEQAPTQSADRNNLPGWDENFSKASLDDLSVGQKIMIMGTENSDKTVSAQRILIGADEIDFGDMARNTRLPDRPVQDQAPNQLPLDNKTKRSNFEQFQDLSPEQRDQLRQEMQPGGSIRGERPFGADQGRVNLRGEIINKDGSSLTLKLEDSGSKLVFFSGETVVSKFNQKKEE